MAELRDAQVPDIGSDDKVPVIELLVQVGDTVTKDQGLVTLESAKATMEVPAPFAGVVRELLVKVGDEIGSGALVARIEAADAAGPAPVASAAKAASPTPVAAAASATAPLVATPSAPATSSDESIVEPVAVVPASQGTADAPPPAPVSAAPPQAVAAAVASTAAAANPATSPTGDAARLPAGDALLPGKLPYASPAVRVFARELGVDLAGVRGTERGGRISRADVQAFVKSALAGGAANAPSAAGGATGGLQLIPWPQVDFAKFGPVQRQPRTRINKLSAANLARNWAMIPHVTQFDEADITEMEAFRKTLGAEQKDVKVTPLVFLIKAVVAALKKYPNFNASLDGDELVLKQYFHVGIAVDTPDGLVVPVIRDADRKGLLELSHDLAEISGKAREKKLAPGDMQGGCFSISSLGGIGGTAFTPIINAPEVAILGVSRSAMKPVWNGGEFAPRLMLPLSLSYDHRVIDGAAAARFTAYLAQVLGDLRRLLV